MIGEVSPGLILIVGALLVPVLRGRMRGIYMLALPILAFAHLISLGTGNLGHANYFGLELTTLRVDRLSLVFGYVFLIAALLGVIYSLHIKDWVQHVAGLIYAGSAIGAVFAGDLVTLFVFWEGTAIASVFLIWAVRTEEAYATGLRYLLIQVGSGVLLLAGVLLFYHQTGSVAFERMELNGAAATLMMVAFGIKCAFPLLHGWMKDAYPASTVTGAIFLSAFTTKLAVYALARGFAGTEILVPIGATMALFPVVLAMVENDIRRVLAYGLNTQLGFMVVGVGIGTPLAINGVAAHAFCCVLYTALMFMSTGAILHRTGTAKATDLGGLLRMMPWTAAFFLVGAASIASVPLFNGFVSKSMIVSAALEEGAFIPWLALVVATIGVFLHTTLKLPYLVFLGSRDKQVEEAPPNMLAAMGITAVLCVGIGILYQPLYAVLPFKVDYPPFTLEHIVTQLQTLVLAGLVFAVLVRTGHFPMARSGTVLDVDWIYRKPLRRLIVALAGGVGAARSLFIGGLGNALRLGLDSLARKHEPGGLMGRSWTTSSMALWAVILLALYLVLYYTGAGV